MTIPRLMGFAEYWSETPPINEIVAQVFGGESKSADSPAADASLLDLFPQRG